MTTVNAQAKRVQAVNTKQIEDAVANSKQAVEKTIEVSKAQFDKAATATLKSYDEVANASKEQVDILMRSSNVLSKGVEEMGRAIFDLAQASAEAQVEATKALFAAKTVNDLMELQNDYMRASFDKFIAESARISEMGLKVANDVAAPAQAYVNANVEKFSKQFAA